MLIENNKRYFSLKIKAKFVKKGDGDLFILSDDEKSMSIVNEVGARIIELADGTKTLEDITKIIMKEYSVDRKILEKDVRNFIKEINSSALFVASKP